MNTLNDIRAAFLAFFEAQGHKILPSASLIPQNDPTLLFTNAGMVPFKDIFTGRKKPDSSMAASAQKCIRAGGKHNDLDNVGYTTRHHTFFEMLGNFSFGGYFKEQAITYAWQFLHETLALPTDRLWVTVYHEDEESALLWRKIAAIPESRILPIATQDNFWSMGAVGPCGPCSEIFYDHGENIAGGPPGSPDQEGDRFVEIWNLVFMQFERNEAGGQIKLPSPSIDTGMGLERMAAVLQGTYNNYEIDLFKNLIAAIETVIALKAGADNIASFRVVADHLRAVCFLMADGVQPANEGRGYVLRRILRRAMRHLYLLGQEGPRLYRLVPALENEMAAAYPEFTQAVASITETLKNEEERFADMLYRGMGLLEKEMAGLQKGQKFSGEMAFKLYDTYGFPLDLTEDVLRREGRQVDVAAFDAMLNARRDVDRLAWRGSGDQSTHAFWLASADRLGPTNFLGYAENQNNAKIIAIVKDGAETQQLDEGNSGIILLDQTVFYAESGGQVGDRGVLSANANRFEVEDTQKQAGLLHGHIGRQVQGQLRVGDEICAAVDHARRDLIRANHSATHLMHEALRQILGAHVAQKGSLVDETHLRFDFSHNSPIRAEEIAAIEKRVNSQIRKNLPTITKIMPQDKARESGALAMFGEKYDNEVRVLFMGAPEDNAARTAFSIEFCGGTHVARAGDIALFKIVSQSAVGAGVRRVIALTGEAAFDYFIKQETYLHEAAGSLKVPADQLPERLLTLVEENKRLTQSLRDAKRKLALAPAQNSATSNIETIGSVKFMHRVVEGMDMKDIRKLIDDAKQQLGSGIVAMIALNDGRAALAIGVTKDLTPQYDAVVLAKMGAALLGGSGGGGRADMALAGGPNGDQADAAIQALRDALH